MLPFKRLWEMTALLPCSKTKTLKKIMQLYYKFTISVCTISLNYIFVTLQ